jgi:co-chaperonin GroES (HSP10)
MSIEYEAITVFGRWQAIVEESAIAQQTADTGNTLKVTERSKVIAVSPQPTVLNRAKCETKIKRGELVAIRKHAITQFIWS